ncbi:hypothetical protein [Ruegeria marina]|uniref:hypothetical protein n=1 Tax=Ruegeria marina TaxID=639004 RepID=UPI000B80A0C6|nr:hypothetical protein [Ruegeria marina]
MYSVTAQRMISGLVLKQRNGDRLGMAGGYKTALPASGQFALTAPSACEAAVMVEMVRDRGVDASEFLQTSHAAKS